MAWYLLNTFYKFTLFIKRVLNTLWQRPSSNGWRVVEGGPWRREMGKTLVSPYPDCGGMWMIGWGKGGCMSRGQKIFSPPL